MFSQSCKNVQTVPTSRCYFFWPVLIFGKSTQKTVLFCVFLCIFCVFLVLIFLGEKLVSANFYAFCNYVFSPLQHPKNEVKFLENIFLTLETFSPWGIFTKLTKVSIVAFIKTKILRPVLSLKKNPFKNDNTYGIVHWLQSTLLWNRRGTRRKVFHVKSTQNFMGKINCV